MSAYLRWLDFSSAERDRTLEVLASLKEKSTVDDLGIGIVRDQISERLCPGMSTIQTRAKYFLFVPWILRGLEESSVADDSIEHSLKQREIKLIASMKAGGKGGNDIAGLIGSDAGAALKRFPSSVYWNGLKTMGICHCATSLNEYVRTMPEARAAQKKGQAVSEDTDEPDEAQGSWDDNLPASGKPAQWNSFALSFAEADYLRSRAKSCRTDAGSETLLAWCARNIEHINPVEFGKPWEVRGKPPMEVQLQADLRHARHFSLCMWGAYASYNVLLARTRKDDTLIARHEAELDKWIVAIAAQCEDLAEWVKHLDDFWTWLALPEKQQMTAYAFVESWSKVLTSLGFTPTAENLLGRETAKLIVNRESALKLGLARLRNPKALARWEGTARAEPLNYRWPNAVTFLSDIRQGLTQGRDDAHAR